MLKSQTEAEELRREIEVLRREEIGWRDVEQQLNKQSLRMESVERFLSPDRHFFSPSRWLWPACDVTITAGSRVEQVADETSRLL